MKREIRMAQYQIKKGDLKYPPNVHNGVSRPRKFGRIPPSINRKKGREKEYIGLIIKKALHLQKKISKKADNKKDKRQCHKRYYHYLQKR